MKKALSIVMALTLLLCAIAAAEAGLANPWTHTTPQELMDVLGLQLGLPDGATNVIWQMMESEKLGEVQFDWDGEHYNARIQSTEAFDEGISGMYYDWEVQDECTVGRCNGVCKRAYDGENTVDLCMWYDDLTGLMYSVSVVDTDLDGFDILAAANKLYIPAQTE